MLEKFFRDKFDDAFLISWEISSKVR